MMVSAGVLALQGAFAEHMQALERCHVSAREVRCQNDLDGLHALILPGGESTVMGRLLLEEGLLEPVTNLVRSGLPVLATCAGMILLARELPDHAGQPRTGLMDISVRRNAFGRQQESFTTFLHVAGFSLDADDLLPAVFIRAPLVVRCGPGVRVLASVDGHAVAVAQDNMLALSFHPELTEDLRFHSWLATKAEYYAQTAAARLKSEPCISPCSLSSSGQGRTKAP